MNPDGPPLTQVREPFWGWPGWAHLGYFALLGLGQTLWFGLIFVGANYLTAAHEFRVKVHMNAELNFPMIPEMIVIYMSIYSLFLMAPFVLRTRQQLVELAVMLARVTVFGGICFLILPAELGFLPPEDLGLWPQLFHFADWLNLDYNLVPSLHVALSVVCVAIFSDRVGMFGMAILWSWAAAIALSTVFTHQHHIVDVISGFILGLATVRLCTSKCGLHLCIFQFKRRSSIEEV